LPECQAELYYYIWHLWSLKLLGRLGLICFGIVLFPRLDTLCFEAWLALRVVCVFT